VFNQAICLKILKRAPNRPLAHSEVLRQIHLNQPVAGLPVSAEDSFLQRRGDFGLEAGSDPSVGFGLGH
jgi:hypothetical protein